MSDKTRHACEGCDAQTPGIRPFANYGQEHAGRPPRGFAAVERCDACQRYGDDLQAAQAWGHDAHWMHGKGTRQAICRPPGHPFPTESIIIEGVYKTGLAVKRLLCHSCWLEITPLPDDLWQITVKAGEGLLQHINQYARRS